MTLSEHTIGTMNRPGAMSAAPGPNSKVSPERCQAECLALNSDLNQFANLAAERGSEGRSI